MIENSLLLGLVLGALAFICQWEELNPKFLQAGRPLIGGTLTGLIMGDVVVGMAVGAILELSALGVNTYGGATIPDFLSGSILGTFFAVSTDLQPQAAVGVAVPIAALLIQLDILARTANVFFQHRADSYAADANVDRVGLMNMLGTLPWGLSRGIPVFFGVWLGAPLMQRAVDASPQWLIDGFQTAGGILPALGIALLLRLLPLGRFWPFLLLGFVGAAYLELDLVGIAIIGGAIAALLIQFGRTGEEAV